MKNLLSSVAEPPLFPDDPREVSNILPYPFSRLWNVPLWKMRWSRLSYEIRSEQASNGRAPVFFDVIGYVSGPHIFNLCCSPRKIVTPVKTENYKNKELRLKIYTKQKNTSMTTSIKTNIYLDKTSML